MIHRILVLVAALTGVFVQQAFAQEMPESVKAELGKLVGKWTMETVVDGETTKSELEAKWTANESVVIFHWSGIDFDTGLKNSGTGMLGWDALRQLVVEHELDKDGASFFSTHHIAKGKWVSLTNGAIVADGKATYIESHREFKFASANTWTVVGRDRVVGGKAAPDVVSTFIRK